MRTRVKICGLTNQKDVELAINCGADALGFVFSKSVRRVTPEFVMSIRKLIPPFVTVTGVFVDEKMENIREIYGKCQLGVVQLHGSEDRDYLRQLGLPCIKAFRAESETLFSDLEYFGEKVFLLDSSVHGKFGGAGVKFDWEIAKRASAYGKVILAGGLTPGNIAGAIALVKPYAVDVSSGVESEPGIKSERKMIDFFRGVTC